MATMNISLPDPMRDWVEAQTKGGKYASSSDYVRDLIRRDQESRDKLEALRAEIDKGLKSGVSNRTMDDILDDVKKRHANEGI